MTHIKPIPSGKLFRHPWAVTTYEGYARYHVEEGGYYYPCRAPVAVALFRNYSDAIQHMENIAGDLELDIKGKHSRLRQGHYVGDETLVVVEKPWEIGNSTIRPSCYC